MRKEENEKCVDTPGNKDHQGVPRGEGGGQGKEAHQAEREKTKTRDEKPSIKGMRKTSMMDMLTKVFPAEREGDQSRGVQ